jgi:hypothetical protein
MNFARAESAERIKINGNLYRWLSGSARQQKNRTGQRTA